ncbi:hypothetical protein DFP73DRAFT_524686 [Morchella snyderi]|nr:hypothetical protein DFP73DRAFT_524686 [Morchella snyderi]
MSTPHASTGYANPTTTHLPHVPVVRAPTAHNTTAGGKKRGSTIAWMLNPIVPEVAADCPKPRGTSTSSDSPWGSAHTSGIENPTSFSAAPQLSDPHLNPPLYGTGAPSSSSSSSSPTTPGPTALPFMEVVLPAPGLAPRDAHHLVNLNHTLTAHSERRNYERLHDALLCLDYVLKRPPYTTAPIYQPLLQAWMVYKDRYLEHESSLIRLRLIPEPHNYTVVRNMVLVRNVWPEWVPGMLVGREGEGEVKGPGGRRVEKDILVRSALANMVFTVEVGRESGMEGWRGM